MFLVNYLLKLLALCFKGETDFWKFMFLESPLSCCKIALLQKKKDFNLKKFIRFFLKNFIELTS